MNHPEESRTERGARLVGAGILVSRIVGLVRFRVVAYFLGNSPEAGAYTAALRIPNAVRNLLGDGAISASFVPVYAAALERGDEKGARALANSLLGVLLVAVSALTIAGIALAPVLTAVFVPEYTDAEAAMTTRFMRVLFPMTGVMVLSGWFLGVQNANRRFFTAYASAAAWSVAQIVVLLIAGPGAPDLETIAWYLSWATLAGALLQVAVQVPQVVRVMGSIRPSLDTNAPGLADTIRNFIPVVTALGVAQLSGFTDLFLASFVSSSAVAALGNASQLYLLPLSLFGVATAVAALPELARGNAVGNRDLLVRELTRAWERVLFYTIPAAFAFIGIGDCIVALVYEGGAFGAEDRTLVWLILAAYSLGLSAYALARVAVSSYQAVQNYRIPLIAALWALGTSAAVSAALSLPFRDRDVAVAGIALGSAVGAYVNLTMLLRGLRAHVGVIDTTGPITVARKTFLAAALAMLTGLLLRSALKEQPIFVIALVVLPAFGLVFLWAAKQQKLTEADRMVGSVLRRLGLFR